MASTSVDLPDPFSPTRIGGGCQIESLVEDLGDGSQGRRPDLAVQNVARILCQPSNRIVVQGHAPILAGHHHCPGAAYVSSAAGTAITPEVAATVGHKWLGDSREAAGEVEPSTSVLAALAADLQVVVFWPTTRDTWAMTRLEFWPDYGAGPLWTDEGKPADLESLSLPHDLVERVRSWNSRYEDGQAPHRRPGRC